MNRFLGADPDRTIAQVRSRAPCWFEFAEDVAGFCSDLLPRIKPSADDGQQVLSAALYRRILSTFEAIVLTAERGMHREGTVLRRSMLEALFILGAMQQQPNLVSTYVQNDNHRRLKIYNNLEKMNRGRRRQLLPEINDDALRSNIEELRAATKSTKYLSTKSFSQAAKLHDLYLSDYCLLSEGVHHSAKDLEDQVTAGGTEDIDWETWGPVPDPPADLLSPATDQLLKATRYVDKIFRLSVKKTIDRFKARSGELQVQNERRGRQDSPKMNNDIPPDGCT